MKLRYLSAVLGAASMAALVYAAPARAEWQALGAIDMAPGTGSNLSWNDVAGPVTRLGFRADGGRLACSHIRVVYPNGDSQDVFSGAIFRGQNQTITFPDGPRPIARVDVACHTDDPRGAKLLAWADMVGPRGEGPLPRRPLAYRPMGWTPLGEEDFGRMNHHSMLLSTQGDQPLAMIGVEPMDGDARCVSATASFADGSTETAAPNGGRPLAAGVIYHIAVTRDGRALDGLGLTCESLGSDHVTIRVLAA